MLRWVLRTGGGYKVVGELLDVEVGTLCLGANCIYW